MSNDHFKIGATGGQRPPLAAAGKNEARVTHEAGKAAQPVAPVFQPAAAPEPQKIEAVAQRLESYLRSVSRSLEFRVDNASGKTVISVRDSQTGDLIRQIPGDEVLRLAEMAEDQTIVLVNESA